MGGGEINTSNSTNTENMNFFKKLFYLLVDCNKNRPVKFWGNVILLILSIASLVIIRTDRCFIPSIFSPKANLIINLSIDNISFFYIMGLLVYLYWKISPIKKGLVSSSILLFITLISISATLLLIPVYQSLQYLILPELQISLSEFGAFFGSITGLLAFLGVLLSLYLSEKRADKVETISRDRYREDSERTIFFQLLDLHTKKVDSAIYSDVNETTKELIGARAFERFVDKANAYWVLTIVYDYILRLEEDIAPYENAFLKIKDIFAQYNLREVQRLIKVDNCRLKVKGYKDIVEDSEYMDDPGRLEIWKWAQDIESDLLNTKSYKHILKLLKLVTDVLYKEDGHIVGHYFRNMYYVMDTINNFSDKKNYKELFRAQLSRHELILGLFNAVSTNSSLEMVELLEEFDIFKDVYPEDLQLLKIAKEIGIEPSSIIKNILNEYKNNVANKSDN